MKEPEERRSTQNLARVHGAKPPERDHRRIRSSYRPRRLQQVWADASGGVSYLLTLCVQGRAKVLDNEPVFQRLVQFLLDSPARYEWFARRFVVMPDHLHLIAAAGRDAIQLGRWVKALKAVVGGRTSRSLDQSLGVQGSTRANCSWKWQEGFHDHKLRNAKSESEKWEYLCLNPVRERLVERPEEWPYAGEIFYHEAEGPRFVRGTPPILDAGILIRRD